MGAASENLPLPPAKGRVGRFAVEGVISRGGQGSVYRARDEDLDRAVAIKLLHTGVKTGRAGGGFAEGRALARLRHPNIVSVYEVGLLSNIPYLVLELIHGLTLKEWMLQQGPPGMERALELWSEIVAGVAHAHSAGILHLDLSPGNVMIDASGRARVMDFGVAATVSEALAGSGRVVGTPRYMAPEQFLNGSSSAATDVYALGLLGYEIITGRPVVSGDRIESIIETVLKRAPDTDVLRGRGADEGLVRLFENMLAKDPAARPENAAKVRDLIDAHRKESAHRALPPELKHSTVGFLLRRMERRGDFPALAVNLRRINSMTAEDSKASTQQLAAVVLRDYAMTNKLLKVANSALFRAGGRTIGKVSEAITRLGFDKVRMVCNGLLFIDHLKAGQGRNTPLQETVTKSLVAGLIARHLCTAGIDREEGFICGLFRSVGRTLAMYYFPEDYADVDRMRESLGLAEEEAFRRVFGVTVPQLGMAVAQVWKFPDAYIRSMQPVDREGMAEAQDPADRLWLAAAFANELCDLASAGEMPSPSPKRIRFMARYQGFYRGGEAGLCKLVAAALEKTGELGTAMGLSCETSPALAAMGEWSSSGLPEEPTSPSVRSNTAVRPTAQKRSWWRSLLPARIA